MVPVLLLPCPGMRALEEANPTKHCRQSTVCWGSTPCAHSGRVPSQVQMLTSSPREHSSLWCSLSSVWTIVLRMEGYPCLASLVLRRFGCYHLVSSSYPEFTGNIQINESLSVSISVPLLTQIHVHSLPYQFIQSFHKVFAFMFRNPVVPRILCQGVYIPQNHFHRTRWKLHVSNLRVSDVKESCATDKYVAIIWQVCRIPNTQNPFAQKVESLKKGASYSRLFTQVHFTLEHSS